MSDRMLNVRIDERTMLALADRANETDRTVSDIVRSAVDSALGISRSADGVFTPYPVPNRYQIPTPRRELYRWFRYFAEHNPRLAMGIDLVTDLAGGFQTVFKTSTHGKIYNEMANTIGIQTLAKNMMREVATNGETFLRADVVGDRVTGVVIMDADTVEVDPLKDPRMMLIPNNELRRICMTGEPKEVYDKLPADIVLAVRRGQAYPLDPERSLHIMLPGSGSGSYGHSPIRPMLEDLLEEDRMRKMDPSYAGARVGVDVFMHRLGALRESVAAGINWVFALQAKLLGDDHPPFITWPWSADAEQRWAFAKAWKNGELSDHTFAAAIGAKMPEPKTCQICDRSEMVGFTFTTWFRNGQHIATVQRALEDKGMNLTWDEVEKHCTQHMVCPECKACLIPEEGCIKCHECGHSQCR